MIIEQILGNIHEGNNSLEVIPVAFAWFEVQKKRIKKTAMDGKEFGICVSAVLKDGDILARTDTAVYVCDIQAAPLTKIAVSSMQEMGRLCFELGNRHLSLKIEEHAVLVPYDAPTFTYLEKLGFKVSQVHEKLTDFMECKAHGSSDHSTHDSHAHGHSHAHAHTHSHTHTPHHPQG
ncbi:MAG: urease accessory protein UreE [Pseudomonadota bacterium]